MHDGTTISWPAVWDALAVALDVHVQAGRRHLLIEDVVRFATVAVLADQGVMAGRLAADRTMAPIGRIDLLIDPPSGTAMREDAVLHDDIDRISTRVRGGRHRAARNLAQSL